MGNERWAKALRFVVCFIIILWLMIYISPKSVLTARLVPERSAFC